MAHFNIPIFIPHLGCPFQCIFCNQQKITAQHNIAGDSEIQDILATALGTMPIKRYAEAAFFGGSFTAIDKNLQEHYLGLIKPYLKSGEIQGIRISTRPDFIDREGLDMLLDAGVTTIELGVQSMDDRVLAASGRGYKSEKVCQAMELIRQYPFKVGIQLMIGLPKDNLAADIETTVKTIGLLPDMVRIYPTLVIEGTVLATFYQAGKYEPLTLQHAVEICMHMYLRFQQAGIKVIRLGIHADKELTQGTNILAGPFHPSFGELVQQEIYKKQVGFLLKDLHSQNQNIREIRLQINPRDISKLMGHRKSNIKHWQQVFGLDRIIIDPAELAARDSVLISDAQSLSTSVAITRTEFIQSFIN